jgi:hypothetical protein
MNRFLFVSFLTLGACRQAQQPSSGVQSVSQRDFDVMTTSTQFKLDRKDQMCKGSPALLTGCTVVQGTNQVNCTSEGPSTVDNRGSETDPSQNPGKEIKRQPQNPGKEIKTQPQKAGGFLADSSGWGTSTLPDMGGNPPSRGNPSMPPPSSEGEKVSIEAPKLKACYSVVAGSQSSRSLFPKGSTEEPAQYSLPSKGDTGYSSIITNGPFKGAKYNPSTCVLEPESAERVGLEKGELSVYFPCILARAPLEPNPGNSNPGMALHGNDSH